MIAAVPGIGYLTTYLCEREFAKHFHIPVGLITLETASVIQYTLVAGIVLYSGWGYMLKITNRLAGDTILNPPLWFPLLVLLAPLSFLWRIWWPLVPVAGVGALEGFLAWRRRRGLSKKVERGTIDKHRLLLCMAGITLYWFYFTARGIGHSEALDTKEFYVLSTKPELAILRFYGDRAVAVPFDRMTKRVGPELRIIPIDEIRETLKRECVGPLVPE